MGNRNASPSGAHIRRYGCALALAAGLAPASPAAAAAISLEASSDGDVLDIHASAVVAADPATAWRVLVDYARYPEFIPGLRTSRVIARHGSIVTVAQTGSAALWLWSPAVEATFEIDESAPGRLVSRTIAGDVSVLSSRYTLAAAPLASRTDPPGTRLEFTGRIATGAGLLGRLSRFVVERTARRQLEALAQEMERQGATATHRRTHGE